MTRKLKFSHKSTDFNKIVKASLKGTMPKKISRSSRPPGIKRR